MVRNVLIVGGGRVGRHVAERLGAQRNAVTVVERDPETCDRLRETGPTVVQGDGTDADVLGAAGLAAADVVAALSNDTETNLTVCENAAETAPTATTILRIARDGEQDYGHRRAVDHVVYPAAAAADLTAGQIQHATVD